MQGPRNGLAFKLSSVEKEHDCDYKAEVIEIIKNAIQNKEAIRNALDENASIKRNLPIAGNLANVEDLKHESLCNNHSGIYYRTAIPMTFKNKIWDGKDLKNTPFRT